MSLSLSSLSLAHQHTTHPTLVVAGIILLPHPSRSLSSPRILVTAARPSSVRTQAGHWIVPPRHGQHCLGELPLAGRLPTPPLASLLPSPTPSPPTMREKQEMSRAEALQHQPQFMASPTATLQCILPGQPTTRHTLSCSIWKEIMRRDEPEMRNWRIRESWFNSWITI